MDVMRQRDRETRKKESEVHECVCSRQNRESNNGSTDLGGVIYSCKKIQTLNTILLKSSTFLLVKVDYFGCTFTR